MNFHELEVYVLPIKYVTNMWDLFAIMFRLQRYHIFDFSFKIAGPISTKFEMEVACPTIFSCEVAQPPGGGGRCGVAPFVTKNAKFQTSRVLQVV